MKRIQNLFFLFILCFAIFLSGCEKANDETEKEKEEEKPTEPVKATLTFNWAKAWGTSEADDFSGSVMDNNGNLYFVSSITPDGDMADVAISKINVAAQTLVW